VTARAQAARLWAAAALLLALVLAGQAAADALDESARASTGALLGRTGFAYLAGVRRYAAAVLWARLDPINDDYYSHTPLGRKTFLLPSIRLVTLLDPQLEEPFYVGPFVLYGAGQREGAIELAQEGVRANPDSALVHASAAQLYLAEGRMTDARREADITMTKPWSNESDEFQLLSALEVIFNRTGAPEKAVIVAAERERLRKKFEASGAMPVSE
jgi:tetratricopeptide (TPR) repeat protein